MAKGDMTGSISEMDFKLKISNTSKLDQFFSPAFLMQGCQWKVKIEKNHSKGDTSLAVYLYCENKTTSKNWSAVASAIFKLVPFESNEDPLERHTSHYVFDQNNTNIGYSNFIEWDKLFNVNNFYVQNDTINMHIKIEVADPNERNKSILNCEKIDTCCENDCVTTYRLTVTNIKSFLAIRSRKILLRKLPWYFIVHKNGTGQLSVRLEFLPSRREISCKSKVTVKLISSKKKVKIIEKVEEKTLKRLNNIICNPVSWDELLDPENGYVNNNSIVIEVEVKTSKPEGVSPNDQNSSSNGISKKLDCAICFEPMDKQEISSTLCGHLFCTACITGAINSRSACPSCRAAITLADLRRVYLQL